METVTESRTIQGNWNQLLEEFEHEFAATAADYDRTDTFVQEPYDKLKKNGFLSAMIPKELGGGGVPYPDMCDMLKGIARSDSSTALAMSMHQHLLAANIWKYKHGNGGEDVLRKVADKQLILISTGANDWLESSGQMEKADDGYLVTGRKGFASQSAVGDLLVTSAPYQDPAAGWQVLHFAVSMKAEGVSRLDDWYTMGMRGTGSHTVKLDKVFIPESAIVLRRPQGEFHPVWNITLTVALPLIMSVYVGIAERAAEITLAQAKAKGGQAHLPILIGEMNNELTAAQVLLADMIRITNNFDFEPIDANGAAMLTRKTLVANATVRTVEKGMHAIGGRSYFRSMDIERLFRDVQASAFHPLPEKAQQAFTGNFLIRQTGN